MMLLTLEEAAESLGRTFVELTEMILLGTLQVHVIDGREYIDVANI